MCITLNPLPRYLVLVASLTTALSIGMHYGMVGFLSERFLDALTRTFCAGMALLFLFTFIVGGVSERSATAA